MPWITRPRETGPGEPLPASRYVTARQPADVHDSLVAALGPLTVVTAGANPLPGLSRQEVDHIAISADLRAEEVFGVDRHDADRTLSDHDAVLTKVRRLTSDTLCHFSILP
jgi:hypothetical protein